MKIKRNRSDKLNLLSLILPEDQIDSINEGDYSFSDPISISVNLPSSADELVNNTEITITGPDLKKTIQYQRVDISHLAKLLDRELSDLEILPSTLDEVETIFLSKNLVHPDYVVITKDIPSNTITIKPLNKHNNLLYIGELIYVCGWVEDDEESNTSSYNPGTQYYYTKKELAGIVELDSNIINGNLTFFSYVPATFKGEPWIPGGLVRHNLSPKYAINVDNFEPGSALFTDKGCVFSNNSPLDWDGITDDKFKITSLTNGWVSSGASPYRSGFKRHLNYIGFKHNFLETIDDTLLDGWIPNDPDDERPDTFFELNTPDKSRDGTYVLTDKTQWNPSNWLIKDSDGHLYKKIKDDDHGDVVMQRTYGEHLTLNEGLSHPPYLDDVWNNRFGILSIPLGCKKVSNFELKDFIITTLIIPPSLTTIEYTKNITTQLKYLTTVYFDASDSESRVRGLFSSVGDFFDVEFIQLPFIITEE